MGTSNFHRVNASKVFAVLTNYEQPILDEDGNETDEQEVVCPDYWECVDFIYNIKEEAVQVALNECINLGYNCDEDPHELRSYPTTTLFQFYRHKKYGDAEICVNVNAVLRSAYYEGACLDWYVTYDCCGENNDHIEFLSIMDYHSEMPKGMVAIQSTKAEAWAESTKDELVEIMENLFRTMSMPLNVVAQFSNGETVYAKV